MDELYKNMWHWAVASKACYCTSPHTRGAAMSDSHRDWHLQRATVPRRLCRRCLGQFRRMLCKLWQRLEDTLPGYRARGFSRRQKLRRTLRAPLVLQRPMPSSGSNFAQSYRLQSERLGSLHRVLPAMRYGSVATCARCDSKSVKWRRSVRRAVGCAIVQCCSVCT